jgi:hypothetical protein
MNTGGRIPVCGMIAEYNVPAEKRKGLQGIQYVLTKQLKMQGFIVGTPDFGPAYYQEHQQKMQEWIADGSVKALLHVTEGIDNAPQGFIGLLKGDNFGKAVLKIR